MLNYIRAEVYKLLRRPYTYIALGVVLAIEALIVAGHIYHNVHSGPSAQSAFGGSIVLVTMFGAVGFCACMITGDIVFAGQYKNSTLKNEVSFGLSRTHIYLGKLAAQTLLSIVYMIVLVGFFVGACAVFLPIAPVVEAGEPIYYTPAADALIIVGYYLAVGFPLWIGAQAVLCACQFLVQGEVMWSLLYVGFVFVLNVFLEVAAALTGGAAGHTLYQISQYLPSPMLSKAKEVIGDPVFLGKAWIVGLFWVVAATAVGLYGFSKKEIK